MTRIFEINDLENLNEYLSGRFKIEEIRENLFTEFLKYTRYSNVIEWNKAVRLCECLAIVGWGNHEPLEAIKGIYVNGNPDTFFINKDGVPRFFEAVWSKKKDGLAIDFDRSYYHRSPDASPTKKAVTDVKKSVTEIQHTKLSSQRNWITKNPIWITRGLANCYENSKSVIESLEKELKPELNRRMRPESYGRAINRIFLNCSFSFFDNKCCKCNYIIADDALKLKQKEFYPVLHEMFSKKDIEENGYYLRNRFSYGPFKSETGQIKVGIVFEKEFSEQSHRRQKELLCKYLIQAVQQIAKRLKGKIVYDFDLMISDFESILKNWCEQEIK